MRRIDPSNFDVMTSDEIIERFAFVDVTDSDPVARRARNDARNRVRRHARRETIARKRAFLA